MSIQVVEVEAWESNISLGTAPYKFNSFRDANVQMNIREGIVVWNGPFSKLI